MTKQSSSSPTPSSQDIKLQQLQNDFFSQLKRSGKSENTLKNYKTDLDCFNTYLLKIQNRTDISQFGLSHIQKYGEYLETRYNSDNSRRRRVQALRLFFDYLVAQAIFPSNPVRKIPTSPKFLDVPKPTPFIDLKTLWHHLLEEEQNENDLLSLIALRNQVIVGLIFGAGLKVSDLVGLNEASILVGKKYRVMVQHPKRDPYTVELPAFFTELYPRYIEKLQKLKRKSALKFDHVLFNANHHRILSGGLTSRGLEVVFEELRKKLLITLTPKSLRQACILNWLGKEINESSIKEWMGVAPSYDLSLYKKEQSHYLYNENALDEIYQSKHKKKK